MIYQYHKDASQQTLIVEGQEYRHLFKARRLKVLSEINMRNLRDDYIYRYQVQSIDRKRAILSLISSKIEITAPKRYLHIGWCLIDNKILEKFLAPLNEIGVSKITPLICDRSQRNFKLDRDRLNRILINSSEQCGRSKLMEISQMVSIDEFLSQEDNCYMLNFSDIKLRDKSQEISTIIIGCEGGFTQRERSLFDDNRVVGLDTPNILRSETAVLATSAMILL